MNTYKRHRFSPAIISYAGISGDTTVLISVPELSVLRATMGALADAPIYEELAEETGVGLLH